ncbi:ribonuclease Z [Virgibacillus salexigens]|uniref:Ribonuclease Z n=2 Tax=Virgibacillus TaxID=84406 RepID=A0A024QB52_9BACI|nr:MULTISPECIES: ribonuclease Z [Virgibacillus]GGJ47132.1 ribonuclease Z [Virgibacillus kapii]CDQ39729.1 Ribonuclease Z [Virgibacillus massiliensis]
MELVFLGTGAGVPSKERNVSAIALKLLQEQNCIWLFDCGEATQHQILYTSIKPRKITKIFISHLHGDHIYGLPGLLSSRSFQGGDTPLTIYGPQGLKSFIETSLNISGTHLTYPLTVMEISHGSIIKDEEITVYIEELDHVIPSFGFRIVENDKPGELLVHKLKEMGIEPGPIYQEIKEKAFVETSNGKRIYRKDVIGENKKGRIITILGDTRLSSRFTSFAKNADVLVHESTFREDKEALAEQYFHSTTSQAARLAKESNCKHLILTHISSRYQKEENEQLLQEAQAIFPQTDLAHDFSTFTIK